MDVFSNIILGLQTALLPVNLAYCLLGVFLGIVVGVIPGIGALATMSMLIPMTFVMEPASALIMLAGIYYGSCFGSSVSAILINIPGAPHSAVTCLDGNPMARNGRAGTALLMASIASFIGGTLGIVVLMIFAPALGNFALRIGPAEYFSLVLLGMIASSAIGSGSIMKNIAMAAIGVWLGLIGTDPNTGSFRFTFGTLELTGGVHLIALAMGFFGVSEVIGSIGKLSLHHVSPDRINFRSMLPDRDEVRRSTGPILRGTGLGAFFGALPGTGPTIAAYIAYAVELRISKTRERFGKGAIEGVVAPEAANNAADQTSFIPTLSLGIPGSATMVLLLAALIIQGITPGPTLVVNHPEIVWGLIMSFWVGNIMLLIMNIGLIGFWVRLLLIPYYYLYPAILMFVCVGTYSIAMSSFDVWLMLLFGVAGVLMRMVRLSPTSLLLGFILGPMLEENFRRAMVISRGDFAYFIEQPISATILAITALILLIGARGSIRSARIARSRS